MRTVQLIGTTLQTLFPSAKLGSVADRTRARQRRLSGGVSPLLPEDWLVSELLACLDWRLKAEKIKQPAATKADKIRRNMKINESKAAGTSNPFKVFVPTLIQILKVLNKL